MAAEKGHFWASIAVKCTPTEANRVKSTVLRSLVLVKPGHPAQEAAQLQSMRQFSFGKAMFLQNKHLVELENRWCRLEPRGERCLFVLLDAAHVFLVRSDWETWQLNLDACNPWPVLKQFTVIEGVLVTKFETVAAAATIAASGALTVQLRCLFAPFDVYHLNGPSQLSTPLKERVIMLRNLVQHSRLSEKCPLQIVTLPMCWMMDLPAALTKMSFCALENRCYSFTSVFSRLVAIRTDNGPLSCQPLQWLDKQRFCVTLFARLCENGLFSLWCPGRIPSEDDEEENDGDAEMAIVKEKASVDGSSSAGKEIKSGSNSNNNKNNQITTFTAISIPESVRQEITKWQKSKSTSSTGAVATNQIAPLLVCRFVNAHQTLFALHSFQPNDPKITVNNAFQVEEVRQAALQHVRLEVLTQVCNEIKQRHQRKLASAAAAAKTISSAAPKHESKIKEEVKEEEGGEGEEDKKEMKKPIPPLDMRDCHESVRELDRHSAPAVAWWNSNSTAELELRFTHANLSVVEYINVVSRLKKWMGMTWELSEVEHTLYPLPDNDQRQKRVFRESLDCMTNQTTCMVKTSVAEADVGVILEKERRLMNVRIALANEQPVRELDREELNKAIDRTVRVVNRCTFTTGDQCVRIMCSRTQTGPTVHLCRLAAEQLEIEIEAGSQARSVKGLRDHMVTYLFYFCALVWDCPMRNLSVRGDGGRAWHLLTKS